MQHVANAGKNTIMVFKGTDIIPLARLWDREGPAAKRWEDEGLFVND
jgi:hypothetical protein